MYVYCLESILNFFHTQYNPTVTRLKLTNIAARIATGRSLEVERQRRKGIVLDAVQEETFTEAGRHQPIGGGQRQYHQDHYDEAAYECDHLY